MKKSDGLYTERVVFSVGFAGNKESGPTDPVFVNPGSVIELLYVNVYTGKPGNEILRDRFQVFPHGYTEHLIEAVQNERKRIIDKFKSLSKKHDEHKLLDEFEKWLLKQDPQS